MRDAALGPVGGALPGDRLVEGGAHAERGVLAGRPARVTPFGVVERAGCEGEDLEVIAGDVEARVAAPAAEPTLRHGARERRVLEAWRERGRRGRRGGGAEREEERQD